LPGAVVECALGEYPTFATGGAVRIDWIGKPVVDFATVLSFIPIWMHVKAGRTSG
jgi:hypothetical protein